MIADLVLQEMESRCGLMPQELMVSQSTLSAKADTFVAQAQCRPPGAPPIKPTPSTTVTGTQTIFWDALGSTKISGSESGSRPGSAMSSAPSEGGGARSKEVNNFHPSHIFCSSFLCPYPLYIHHSPATCKAKRKARDGNVEEGAKKGGKERRAKERRAKEERRVARGENRLTEKKRRLR